MESTGYDVAIICLNGHKINASSEDFPQHNSKHCANCGAKGINQCPSCATTIRGYYRESMPWGYEVPRHCHECGKPYPWTTDQIEAAKELVALSNDFDDNAKTELIEAIVVGTTETAKTTVAAEKLKKFWPAAGKTLQDVITSVLSETAKKVLFGP